MIGNPGSSSKLPHLLNTRHSPRGFWEDPQTRKQFFEDMAKSLGYKTWEDWYQISWDEIREYGGVSMLGNYDNSPSKVIMETYPGLNQKDPF